MSELATKAGKEASAGSANVHARAGQAIRGNLFRGAAGQFQGGPAAQVASRLKQIRARKAGAGKKPAKPKTTPEQRKAAKQQAKDAARGKTLAGLGIDAGGQAALTGLAAGTQPDAAAVERGGFLAAGLVEKAQDGSYRMTAAGRGLLRAAESGDAGRAGDVISSARDKIGTRQAKQGAAAQQKQQRQAKQAAAQQQKQQRAALAKKQAAKRQKTAAAAREQRQKTALAKKQQRQTAAEARRAARAAARAVRLAARAKSAKKDTDMDYAAILDDLSTHGDSLAELIDESGAIKAGARHSAGDNKLVQSIYDAAEDIQELAIALGATPIDEADEEPDEADAETGDTMKAITADPVAYAYQECSGIQQATDALRILAQLAANEASEQDTDTPGILAQLRQAMQIVSDFIRGEIGEIKSSIAGKTDDAEMVYGSEIKALEDGAIGGYAVLFGTAETPDMSDKRDYFTKSTEYWLDRFGWPRPMTYHHGIDEDTAGDPIVGNWTKAVVKDEGIWLEGQLDRAHRYHGAIKELIRRGYLKLSSDSAPQWVVREKQPNGANEVKRWPLITASPTVTPAEPRLSGISFKALCAELGMNDTNNPEATDSNNGDRSDETKALAERSRKLLLELDLLDLEVTT